MKERLSEVIKKLLVILTLGLVYRLIIIKTGIQIPCFFRLVTRLKCPGCGVTSMCLSLMNFDFYKAFKSNEALFILMPLLFSVFLKYTLVYIKTGRKELDVFQKLTLNLALIILVLFGVLRNFYSL